MTFMFPDLVAGWQRSGTWKTRRTDMSSFPCVQNSTRILRPTSHASSEIACTTSSRSTRIPKGQGCEGHIQSLYQGHSTRSFQHLCKNSHVLLFSVLWGVESWESYTVENENSLDLVDLGMTLSWKVKVRRISHSLLRVHTACMVDYTDEGEPCAHPCVSDQCERFSLESLF